MDRFALHHSAFGAFAYIARGRPLIQPPATMANAHFLVVTESSRVAAHVVDTLASAGHHLIEAADAVTASKLLTGGESPAIVLLDWSESQATTSLLRVLRETPRLRSARVVALSDESTPRPSGLGMIRRDRFTMSDLCAAVAADHIGSA